MTKITLIRIPSFLTFSDHPHIREVLGIPPFDWYMLDISKSATAITYSWLRESFKFDVEGDYLTLVQAINAHRYLAQ